MKIASWNCNNLNPRSEKKENRKDYLKLLRDNIPDLDVIFLMEVESVFPQTALDKDFSFHFFFPCTELDQGWTPMTSGIFLSAAKHVAVVKHEVLLPGEPVPAKWGRGKESEYGFAFKTLLHNSKSGEMLDLVTFWNTKRKSTPCHDYAPTLKLLLKKLADTGFFSPQNPHMIIGDFNLGYQYFEDQNNIKLIPASETVLVKENTYFKKKNPDELGSSLDHIICGQNSRIHFLTADGNTADDFGQSLGRIAKNDFVKTGLSDHLPLFVQIDAK